MTNIPSDKTAFRRGQELAEQGRLPEALACFREHLLEHPDDGEAVHDAGTVLYALGRFEEAVRHLCRACELLGPAAIQTRVNLAEALLGAAQPARALPLLEGLAQARALPPDLANRVAVALMEQHCGAGAMSALLLSRAIMPNQNGIGPILDRLRAGRPKVALLAGETALASFGDIRAFVEARFPARTARFGADLDVGRMQKTIDWCDIAWVDGCLPLLALLTGDKGRRRIVCRLSQRETVGAFSDRVRWENIDVLVVHGGPSAREAIERYAPACRQAARIVELPPGVDAASIPAGPRAPGLTLAWVAGGEEAPGAALLLQCFRELRSRDARARLHVAGVFQDGRRSWEYLDHMARRMGLSDAIVLDGWQEDLPGWLQDKHFFVSTRLWDEGRADLLQAMAAGAKPVVHAFPGSEEFVPPECLFDTVEDFCRLVLKGGDDPMQYRQYVCRRFDLRQGLRVIDGLLAGLEESLRAPASPPRTGART